MKLKNIICSQLEARWLLKYSSPDLEMETGAEIAPPNQNPVSASAWTPCIIRARIMEQPQYLYLGFYDWLGQSRRLAQFVTQTLLIILKVT